MTALVQYVRARAALAEATRVDEVLPLRDAMEHVKLHARQVQDRALLADATEIQNRAERKLGELIREAETAGLIRPGRPRKASAENPAGQEGFTLGEIGVSHKLSSLAQQKASLSERAFEAMVSATRERIVSGKARIIEPEIINGARAVMGSRAEPDDSLDYFPTPPWATRALLEEVLPHLGVDANEDHLGLGAVWDPACGEGHITGVLEEYPCQPIGSDIFDYSADGHMPPSWWKTLDFLASASGEGTPVADWIITNPPFDEKATAFVKRAFEHSPAGGIAMFFRLQWLETIERYELIFRDNPPTLSRSSSSASTSARAAGTRTARRRRPTSGSSGRLARSHERPCGFPPGNANAARWLAIASGSRHTPSAQCPSGWTRRPARSSNRICPNGHPKVWAGLPVICSGLKCGENRITALSKSTRSRECARLPRGPNWRGRQTRTRETA